MNIAKDQLVRSDFTFHWKLSILKFRAIDVPDKAVVLRQEFVLHSNGRSGN